MPWGKQLCQSNLSSNFPSSSIIFSACSAALAIDYLYQKIIFEKKRTFTVQSKKNCVRLIIH